jgi:hypothetical protein
MVILPAPAFAQAPHHKESNPITDKAGRTRIIIDFTDAAREAYPRELLLTFDPKRDTQQPQSLALVKDYEKRLGFTRESMTTWVGASVTAFLTPQQVELLRADKNVQLLTEDGYMQYSTPPAAPWAAAWNGAPWGELNDWGRRAVNGKVKLPGSTRKVYVIDGGVAYHQDLDVGSSLSNTFPRVNVACGSGADCSGQSLAPHGVGGYPTVGCNGHATHVAGIIGALPNNGQTRMGVYAGVDMVSVAIGTSVGSRVANTWIPCAGGPTQLYEQSGATYSSLGAAFDYIYFQNFPFTGVAKPVAIATMSMNTGRVGFTNGFAEVNRAKLMRMVTPTDNWVFHNGSWYYVRYNGVFFAQSAGNQNQNVCTAVTTSGNSLAFQVSNAPTDTAIDGIMVVGAVGTMATAISGTIPSNPLPPTLFTLEEPRIGINLVDTPGSNWGKCVDIWAPGDFIYSTWGKGDPNAWSTAHPLDYGNYTNSANFTINGTKYSGNQPSNYVPGSSSANFSGWQWLSGTSMAAPHVAAAAAYLADKFALNSPLAIEEAIRNNWRSYGTYFPTTPPADPQNLIKVVYLPD